MNKVPAGQAAEFGLGGVGSQRFGHQADDRWTPALPPLMSTAGMGDEPQFPKHGPQGNQAGSGEGLVRPVLAVRQFQRPELIRAHRAGEEMLAVNGFQMAEGQPDEALVALAAIPLEGGQELPWEFNWFRFKFHRSTRMG